MLMLEEFAFGLLNRSEGELTVLGLLLTVAGFVAALAIRRGATLSLRRVPYFIWSAAVFGLASALPLAWLLTIEAAQNGVLWTLVALVYGGIFAFGYAYGVLGHARSVNAYGDGGSAWIAIVPFANLVLFFKRPADWSKGTLGKLALGTLGVVFGLFLMLLGAGIGKVAEQRAGAMVLRAQNDPEMQQISINMMLTNQGLETTLRQMAAEVPSQRVDEVTTLLRVESAGSVLRYVYEISTDVAVLPASISQGLAQSNCLFELMRPVIEAGATIEHVYQRVDGSEIGTVTVTRQVCGY
jgi:hypothetical protein